ncbi:STAS/SEC14 domain-containing protein [Rufibacter quisquiliarum]|uniref:STAS/SEC14 domain-containing protein n=1 Tax=Rufibacter quisquiliarum TaxID=1549639 RepID=A0A839GJZ9_9BACT|nr:STAS/SEC14 domain-containing protein [Rufibacter quisquiliarum]MBA9075307.1 hypothetical protein [Rufibacter quisquiliarum]
MTEKFTTHAHVVCEGEGGDILFRWQGEVIAQEFYEAATSLLEFSKAYPSPSWLIDLQEMGPIPVDDQSWLFTEWLQQFLQLRLKKIALIPSMSTDNQMAIEYLIREAKAVATFDIQFFGELDEAREWLTGSVHQETSQI